MIRHGKSVIVSGALHRSPYQPERSKIWLPTVSFFTLIPKTKNNFDLACRRHNPETWFQEEAFDVAKMFCNACPIQDLCLEEAMRLEYGLALMSRHGVWGGLTPEERFELERSRNEAA